MYLESLSCLNIDKKQNDIRLVEDNWENPTLGAWGLGWEVWLNGMEVTQFTYFQQIASINCKPITCEITYGVERLALHIQEKEDVYELIWMCWENDKGKHIEVSYEIFIDKMKLNNPLITSRKVIQSFYLIVLTNMNVKQKGS